MYINISYLHVVVAICQQRQCSSGGWVGVIDVCQDGDCLIEPLLLDQTIDGAGVLPVFDVKLVHGSLTIMSEPEVCCDGGMLQ